MKESVGEYIDYSNGVPEEIKRKEINLNDFKNTKKDLEFLRSELDHEYIKKLFNEIIYELNEKIETVYFQLDYLLENSDKYSKYEFLSTIYFEILIFGGLDNSNDFLYFIKQGVEKGYIYDLNIFLVSVSETEKKDLVLENYKYIINDSDFQNMNYEDKELYIDSKSSDELAEIDKIIIKFFINSDL